MMICHAGVSDTSFLAGICQIINSFFSLLLSVHAATARYQNQIYWTAKMSNFLNHTLVWKFDILSGPWLKKVGSVSKITWQVEPKKKIWILYGNTHHLGMSGMIKVWMGFE